MLLNDSLFSKFGLITSATIMLSWSIFEIISGHVLNISVIFNDGMLMVAHTCLLFLAEFIVWGKKQVSAKVASWLEIFPSSLIACYLIWAAFSAYGGHGHHHMPENGGFLISLFGGAGFLVHSLTAWLLSKTAHHNNAGLLTRSCCYYILSHTFIAGSIILGGLITQLTPWDITPILNVLLMWLMITGSVYLFSSAYFQGRAILR